MSDEKWQEEHRALSKFLDQPMQEAMASQALVELIDAWEAVEEDTDPGDEL